MKKKIIGILIILVLIGAFIANHLITYARVADTPLYANLMTTDASGIGYGIGDPTPTGTGKYIWNIISYGSDEENATPLEEQRNLYCVNADYGETWFDDEQEEKILEYKLYYDIQNETDRNEILNLNDNFLTSLLLPEAEGGKYEKLLWLFDNFYIPDKQGQTNNFDEYLAKVGIASKYDGTETFYYNKNTNTRYTDGDLITPTDIIAVQKMAVWYFTNNDKNDDKDDYDYINSSSWLTIAKSDGTYPTLSSVSKSRDEMAMDVYKYLIQGAQNGASQYTSANNYKIDSAPVSVKTEGLTVIEKTETENQKIEKYMIGMTREEANYLIGPIVIDKNNDLGYDIEILVKDEEGNKLTKDTDYKYIYVDENGNKTEKTEQELIGLAGGFYVSVPRSRVENVTISVNVSYKTTPKKLWLDEKVVEGETIINSEQPLVEIIQDPQNIKVELISEPEEFDLALRKYITGLHDKDGNVKQISNVRNLNNIELGTLSTETTATYNHRKDPVVVEDGDEVTYTIRVYNEGNEAGYATKIIDQLPDGLVSSTNNESVVESKGPNGEVRNKYKLDYYYTDRNQIELTLIQWPEELEQGEAAEDEGYVNDIQPYSAGNLDYEEIEVKCMVAHAPDTKNQITLTNIAWIAAAYNSDKQVEILNKGQDRDSETYTSPSKDAEELKTIGNIGYIGNEETNSNKNLSEEVYFKGQQDDDDFEKLVIMPVEKIFDLELVKFIAAISDDAKIDDGEYLTDTKNADGIYERAPKISIIKEQDSDKRRIHCDWSPSNKNPVLVEAGDYVLYTIRVYNAGEVDGYAAEIKDHLPVGLEYVETTDKNAEFYKILWNIDRAVDENGDEKQIISTTHLAKGHGEELEAKEGEERYTANLLRALNVDGDVTDGENRNPDYRDLQVLCRVKENAQKDGVLINYAQISKDTDKDENDINDVDSTPGNLPESGPHEDDEDYEKIKLQCFDLSLRKFITKIQDTEITSRIPQVDIRPLNNNEDTAIYNHPKQPVAVQVGDKIVYTIRVYNEGSIKGYASEVKDYLPPYLTYLENSEINKQYGWQISDEGRVVTTKYLANTELKAFNGTELDYADLKIECIVSEKAPLKVNQTNIAEISEYTYNGGTVEKDIDSTADNMENKIPTDENLPSYKNDELNKEYVPGNEDDDDFEKIYVKQFDLALRKFITKIQETEVTSRIPQVDITPLNNGKDTATYTHPKDALTVHVGDVVIYTLRVYNEGEIAGYANEITDDIPEYLEYLPEDSTNTQYMWKMYDKDGNETENVEEAVSVKTQYLSKENGEQNLIKAFDGTTLDYKEIKIAFKVKDPNSNTYIITNHAQISEDTDENGNSVNDKDSDTEKWNEGEDDQDIENVKVQYFDLSLLKFVSKVIVIEDGKETITETGYNGHENPEPVVKVELHKKKLNQVVVKFGYGITITNEGDIAGYATEITDYVPEGLKFDPNDNPEWMDEGNNVISTRQLENTLLQPGESKTIEVIFTWINSPDNLAQKTNTAEISEDKNEYDVPDRDSTPDNKVDGEDDIDIAKVILAISTGRAQTYFTLTLGLLAVIAIGVALIKKFVI